MERYSSMIRWSDQDEAFIAEIPELPGCMADGETREEALRNLEEVQAIWIKTARRLGRPIPEPAREYAYA